MGTSRGGSTGAVAADGDDGGRKRGLWWLWALLALLLIALVLWLLLSGDDDEDSASTGAQSTATATPSPAPTPAAGGAGDAGTLTAGSTTLLPVGGGADLSAAAGESATGDNVVVQEIVEGQGFWVGASTTDRVYVELGGDVGEDEQPAGDEKLAVGDRVDLTGEARPAPEDPEQTLNLDAASAKMVTDQGVFVNADKVTPVP